MIPFLPFAVGILTGAVATRLLRADKARAGLEVAREKVRRATVDGLSKIESSSAAVRERLEAAEAAQSEAVAGSVPPVVDGDVRQEASAPVAPVPADTPERPV